MVGYPVFLRSTNLEIHADRLFVFLFCEQIVSFGRSLQSFTVRILGDFPGFLSALASNNAFIGASLSEPHTSVTALQDACVCMSVCVRTYVREAIYRKF